MAVISVAASNPEHYFRLHAATESQSRTFCLFLKAISIFREDDIQEHCSSAVARSTLTVCFKPLLREYVAQSKLQLATVANLVCTNVAQFSCLSCFSFKIYACHAYAILYSLQEAQLSAKSSIPTNCLIKLRSWAGS